MRIRRQGYYGIPLSLIQLNGSSILNYDRTSRSCPSPPSPPSMLTIIASHFIGQSFFPSSPLSILTPTIIRGHPRRHVSPHFQVSESLFIPIQLLWFHPRTDMAILSILSKRQLAYEGPRKSTLKTYILHPHSLPGRFSLVCPFTFLTSTPYIP